MSERNERVEALVKSWVLGLFRDDDPPDRRDHLQACPDATVEDYEARDGSYGCDTGCEYIRVSATVICPHGNRRDWEWGDFGEMGWIIKELIEEDDADDPDHH